MYIKKMVHLFRIKSLTSEWEWNREGSRESHPYWTGLCDGVTCIATLIGWRRCLSRPVLPPTETDGAAGGPDRPGKLNTGSEVAASRPFHYNPPGKSLYFLKGFIVMYANDMHEMPDWFYESVLRVHLFMCFNLVLEEVQRRWFIAELYVSHLIPCSFHLIYSLVNVFIQSSEYKIFDNT